MTDRSNSFSDHEQDVGDVLCFGPIKRLPKDEFMASSDFVPPIGQDQLGSFGTLMIPKNLNGGYMSRWLLDRCKYGVSVGVSEYSSGTDDVAGDFANHRRS